MTRPLRRRWLFALPAAAALASPFAASAQQSERPRRIGVLISGDERDPDLQAELRAFWKALEERGWVPGHTIAGDVRWAVKDLGSPAREIVAARPEVIVAYATAALLPLAKETHSIPIVFLSVSDPLAQGIVPSLAHPGGNLTGFSNPPFSVVGKALALLKEVAPSTSHVAVVLTTRNAAAPGYARSLETFAKTLAVAGVMLRYEGEADLERIVRAFAEQPNGALFFPLDTGTNEYRDKIVALAAQLRLPAIYAQREIAAAGGLMSYGVDQDDQFRGAADYVDRILRGAKPGDLPVQEPTRYDFVINLKTAKALGLEVPLRLQMSANQVIE